MTDPIVIEYAKKTTKLFDLEWEDLTPEIQNEILRLVYQTMLAGSRKIMDSFFSMVKCS